MNRKKFIRVATALASLGYFISSCTREKKIKGRIIGASAAVGHLLRDKKERTITETVHKKTVIVGAGVSGLSAARYLQQQGMKDFMVIDLEKEVGGNAAHGVNDVSAYPWGAHYIPIPNNALTEYLDFLKDCNVITATNADGLPVYNDYYLCFDPEERLYINGKWQDGLVPHYGVPSEELLQIEKFLQRMDEYRRLTGADGRDAFAIPVDESSKDPVLLQLDTLNMKQWLTDNALTSPYLHAYVNYCTRDDFGTPHDRCSAWAGIHYFAGRKGKGANAGHSDVLTWAQGNGFLITQLQKELSGKLFTNCLATRVEINEETVLVEYLDTLSNTAKAVIAEQCILAVPQFIAARLMNDKTRQEKVQAGFHYTPWMVANLCVTNLQERSGAPLSWDNVLFESESLGYVDATHQNTQQHTNKRNLTYYLPLTQKDPMQERKKAQLKTHDEWVAQILEDLRKVHPDIDDATEEINIMLWGHAMAQPLPGMIHGSARKELGSSIGERLHFAHTDLAGISIFEEGFYQGLRAAKKVATQMNK